MDTAWLYYRGAIETINRSLKMKETYFYEIAVINSLKPSILAFMSA